MKYKKFFIIPVLIFIYVYFIVDFLVSFNPTVYSPAPTEGGIGGQPIFIGESVSVVVTRPYFFGLVRMPVYTNYIGYIGNLHEMFFSFIVILIAGFLIIELRNIKKGGEEVKMKMGGLVKRLGKGLAFGVVFGLVTYIFSGDAGISTGLAMLLIYLEYKLK